MLVQVPELALAEPELDAAEAMRRARRRPPTSAPPARSARRYPPSHAVLPAPRRPAQEAAHRAPRQRHAAHRGGDGLRGVLGPRVDPLPPAVAVPGDRVRRVRADRARGMGARRARAPAPAHLGRRARRRRGHRPAAADVEQRRRDLARAPDRRDGLLLPERRGRRGDLRPRGRGHARDDLRRPAVRTRRLHRRAARHDLPLPARGRAALPRLRDAGPDHDPEALPQRARPADGARAVLPPRHPRPDRAAHPSRPRRVHRSRCACATATRPT